MKVLKSSLNERFAFLASLLLLTGCATGQRNELASNSLRVDNRTAYVIRLFRGGEPWTSPECFNGRTYQVPLAVLPHTSLTIAGCSTDESESVRVELVAKKEIAQPCMPLAAHMMREVEVARRVYVIKTGTCQPGVIIVIRDDDFK